MEAQELLAQAKDAITVKRVFGDPYERNGVTLLPVADVRGGGGSGGNKQSESERSGPSYGFGVRATPAGVYVIEEGRVTWQPALDLNRVILRGQLVALAAFLTLRVALKTRGKTKRAKLRSGRMPWGS
ncbi:MAG: spore germination protein GerW family protein [Actinomycetota bacterium]